ncbi:purine nucleoside phosphorylase [Camarhynchus parvulus]|uniref:purine nucleoside phosphorylase n=1 Tax=Geospiza parvula TaxID=87175 RepID=UPI0012382B12|nr:purine nucleoside phosphorylase [Camarhynchus parvulus]
MDGSFEACSEAARWLRAQFREPPRVALVCGSGLGALAEELTEAKAIDYRDIPHFPRSTVQGHAGRLVVGRLGSAPCAVLQGRFHLYEGHAPSQVVIPIRTMALLGVHTLVLTNAAGSLRPELSPGHLLVIRDHIDLAGLAGRSPLVGPNDDRFGPRFPPMVDAYDPALRRLALALAPKELRARSGVYVGVGGPSYETPAECRYLRRVGAHAVGAQVYSQVYLFRCADPRSPRESDGVEKTARHLGLRVLGLSLITNNAPADSDDEDDDDVACDVTGEGGGAGPEARPAPPDAEHEEVLAAAREGARHLRALLAALAPRLDEPGRHAPLRHVIAAGATSSSG